MVYGVLISGWLCLGIHCICTSKPIKGVIDLFNKSDL